jgi:cytochrome c553
MNTSLLSAAALLMLGAFWAGPAACAGDGAELYVQLTCHTCHGPEGKGMVRTETKERYHLKRKEMYQQMVSEGMPVDTVKKLIQLYEMKFEDKREFIEAIQALIGRDETERYEGIVIAIAGRVYYRKGDLIPGFEDYPRHAGNKKLYLYHQMKDILEGRRTNGKSEAMRGIQPYIESNRIKDQGFMAIAEYLSNVKDGE